MVTSFGGKEMWYFDPARSDTSNLVEDVTFRSMATGEESRIPEGVLRMLNYRYNVAFDAR